MVNVDISQIRSALAVVRESEAMWLQLKVSLRSTSSEEYVVGAGLESYLRSTKITFQFQLVIGSLKVTVYRLSKATAILLRFWWSRITRKPQSIR